MRSSINAVRRTSWRIRWLATFRPRELAAEAVKVVEYSDAQRFRLVTVALTSAVLAAFHVVAVFVWGSTGFLSALAPGVFASATLGGTMWNVNVPWLLDVVIPWEAGATLTPVLPLTLFVAWHRIARQKRETLAVGRPLVRKRPLGRLRQHVRCGAGQRNTDHLRTPFFDPNQ